MTAASVLYDLLAQSGVHIPQQLKALSFSYSSLASRSVTEIIATPRAQFKPLRFEIPDTIWPNFTIHHLIIDGEDQIIGSPIQWSRGSWPMRSCPKDQPVLMTIENISGADYVEFRALLLGEETF